MLFGRTKKTWPENDKGNEEKRHWTLAWLESYGLERGRIGKTLRLMLESEVFVLEDRDLVARAVEDYIAGGADFSDYLLGWRSRREGCRDIATFDRKLRSERAFTLLEPNA